MNKYYVNVVTMSVKTVIIRAESPEEAKRLAAKTSQSSSIITQVESWEDVEPCWDKNGG